MNRATRFNRLRYYRHRKGFSIQQVGKLIGYASVSHINEWERGKRVPALPVLLRLALLYGCFIEELYPVLYVRLRHEIEKRVNDQAL